MQPKAWQFVQVDQSSKGKTHRRVVRKAAMKDFRRNERLARTKAYRAMQAGEHEANDTSSEHGGANQHRSIIASGSIERGPGKGIRFIDPFGLTALPDRQDAPVLLLHLLRDVGPKLQPTGSGQIYNPFSRLFYYKSFMDEGLLFALLFHAAVHLDLVRGQSRSPTTLHYRGETLRNLRLRLKSATDAVSDTTIVMVGFIAATGIITGDAAAEKAHTCALRTMVKMRGGLQHLGGEGSLAMLLIISDQLSATILDTDPALEPLDVSENAFAHRVPAEYLGRPIICENTQEFAVEIQHGIHAMASLASLHTEVLEGPISCRSMMSMVQLAYAIEHRLLRARPFSHPDAGTDVCSTLYEAARLALLVCISYIFRNLRASSPALHVLSGRITKRVRSLVTQDRAKMDSGQTHMLVWTLVIGDIASSDRTEYVMLLSEMLWNQRRMAMPPEGFVWTPLMYNESYDALLKDLGDCWEARRGSKLALM